jgi:ribosomal protein S18 acetylase RimI-like enzyme
LTIRQITPYDIEQLEALDKICFSNEVRYNRYALNHYLSLPNSIGLLQSMEDNVQGFIIITMLSDDTANIVTIDVDPSVRNHGIGSTLVEKIKRILKDWKVHKITLQVAMDNTVAINFYLKHGFRIIKRLENYYPSIDGFQMEYMLK